jgi:hypothetical protein
VPKLFINFTEILLHAHGNVEQQNGVFESFIFIIIYYILIVIIYFCIVKIITWGERERAKYLKPCLGRQFRQPATLAASGFY